MRELYAIDRIDQPIVRDFIERQDQLEMRETELRARRFGKRVFNSGDLRAIIHRLRNEQIAAHTLHPNLFTEENIAAYREWFDSLGE